jgi:hypothetical protein
MERGEEGEVAVEGIGVVSLSRYWEDSRPAIETLEIS